LTTSASVLLVEESDGASAFKPKLGDLSSLIDVGSNFAANVVFLTFLPLIRAPF